MLLINSHRKKKCLVAFIGHCRMMQVSLRDSDIFLAISAATAERRTRSDPAV